MKNKQPHRVRSIVGYHRLLGLPAPAHPLVSLIRMGSFEPPVIDGPVSLIFDFYIISLKRNLNARIRYGQQECDFDEGVLFCMAPGQVWSLEFTEGSEHAATGWMLLVHPDVLWNTTLAKTIRQYEYFGYSVYEALYLSEKEESMLTGIVQYIEDEYRSNIDKFSKSVIVAQLEAILTYVDRFYHRQFITRERSGHQILDRMETLLEGYFNDDAIRGLPTVGYVADQLHVSAGYLSELLKALTGQNAQQHIHEKLIEKAKEKLSTSALSVNEIAYELGFEHAQSFNKLFKAKTKLTPGEFRASFQ